MKKEASLVLPPPDDAYNLYLFSRKNNLSSSLLFCTTMMLIISNVKKKKKFCNSKTLTQKWSSAGFQPCQRTFDKSRLFFTVFTFSLRECEYKHYKCVGGITVVAELNKVTAEGKKAFLGPGMVPEHGVLRS